MEMAEKDPTLADAFVSLVGYPRSTGFHESIAMADNLMQVRVPFVNVVFEHDWWGQRQYPEWCARQEVAMMRAPSRQSGDRQATFAYFLHPGNHDSAEAMQKSLDFSTLPQLSEVWAALWSDSFGRCHSDRV